MNPIYSKEPVKVCMISCRHGLMDDRIYYKEALSLQKNGYQISHIGYGKQNREYITEDQVKIIEIEKISRKRIFTDCIQWFRQYRMNDILEAAKKIRADIYHLQDVELCLIFSHLKKLPHKPKVIYDAHETYPDNLKDYWKNGSIFRLASIDIPAIIAEKRILGKADYLIATEENVANRFLKHNPNTRIIYNYSFFSPEASTIQDKKYDVVYCGTLSVSKGIFPMVNMLAACKKRGYHIQAVFAGSFTSVSLEKKIKELIRKHQLEDHIYLTGSIPFNDVKAIYRQSKIGLCLFPKNRSTPKMIPIKLFEYMAFGLPVVGSNFGHIQEIITSNDAGITVDPINTAEGAEAILSLLKNDRYRDYAGKCIQAVKSKYLWEYEEKKLLEIYDTLLSDKHEKA